MAPEIVCILAHFFLTAQLCLTNCRNYTPPWNSCNKDEKEAHFGLGGRRDAPGGSAGAGAFAGGVRCNAEVAGAAGRSMRCLDGAGHGREAAASAAPVFRCAD